jgi:glucosyl-dolichyl phosphate glucuronosyltransferase
MHPSVIIPTYKRQESVLQTLGSLQDQTVKEFEILLVDNAADAETGLRVAEFNKTARIPVRYISHTAGGNSGARNRGAREAQGDLFIYTDDDLTFEPQWIEAYLTRFRDNPAMLVAGGCVRPAWETPPPSWLVEYIGDDPKFYMLALLELSREFVLGDRVTFYSCNMAVRPSVFEWTGFHPEIYGTQTVGDGESGLSDDISRRGGLFGYVPEAIAYHHIPPQRMTVEHIRGWAWHKGGSDMYARWRGRDRSIFALGRAAIGIVRRSWRLWIKGWLVRHRRDRQAIDTQYDASLTRCQLTYLWWMITDQKVRAALDMRDFRPAAEHGVTGI